MQEELQVAEIAVPERVVVPEPVSKGRLEGRGDLRSDLGTLGDTQGFDPRQSYPRCAVAPGGRESGPPVAVRICLIQVLAQVAPVACFLDEQAAKAPARNRSNPVQAESSSSAQATPDPP